MLMMMMMMMMMMMYMDPLGSHISQVLCYRVVRAMLS